MLYVLLRLYNRDREAFQLGNYLVKMTVNEVALILGLPNTGCRFTFSRTPPPGHTHESLTEELHGAATEDWSPTVEGVEDRRISLLIKYLLAMFFFPLKSLKVPSCITKITCVREFVKYNWSLAIHEFLHVQFDQLSRVSAIRSAGSNIGSLEGCATLLLVRLYEHTRVHPPVHELARPRISRWSPLLRYSAKFCTKLQENLFLKNYVHYKFMNVLDEEKTLLTEEEYYSDFENPPPEEHKRKKDRFCRLG
ncbi:hypothetical protein KSP40_PGU012956 [Platanthera guangdongensis]|uniref:Uncharacterized protein n=1 Tax=Platanthera guangdongensis TaxID=2320717 RepID=A0ABR2MDM4_9ASPA